MPPTAEPFAEAPFSASALAWLGKTFDGPTDVQVHGWPAIASGADTLLLAPTGSGKTLAAMLFGIDRAMSLAPDAPAGVRVLYVSPLKALVHDVERNLHAPLDGILRAAAERGEPRRAVRAEMRTGDTPQRDRARQRRDPADILVTTPESLFLILGSQARATLATVEAVIIDEVHAIAGTKRGAHLALSLERLAELTGRPPQRIGLSATVRPVDEVARFLGGEREVQVIDAAAPPALELDVVVPVPDMANVTAADVAAPLGAIRTNRHGEGRGLETQGGRAVAAGALQADANFGSESPADRVGVWPAVYPRLVDLIRAHRSTILFVNSRGLCERLTQRLNELAAGDAGDAEELVLAHHGSASRERRESIESRLKAGDLRGIVATSSLELGIDMGAVDLVILIESPGSAARGLQRVGRSGHAVGEKSRGVLFPKFQGDLLECAAVSRRMLAGEIEAIAVPRNPLDVLAQQLVAIAADAEAGRTADAMFALARRAYPFRDLTRPAFDSVLDMLSGRYPSDEFADLRPRLAWDREHDVLTARRGAAIITRMNAGTIPDRGLFSVHAGHDGPRVGELDEEMVYESRSGDVILLGATSWRVIDITRDRVVVEPAPGEPGRLPFWKGEGPGRPIELGRAVGALARELEVLEDPAEVEAHVRATTPLDELAARNLATYLGAQRAAQSAVPTDRRIVVERFRDELGDWRICILSPFGRRVHAPWALALRAMFADSSGHELQMAVTDDGIVLTLADGDALPEARELIPDPEHLHDLVTDQLAGSAMFGSSFRENAGRALLLPRQDMKRRTPLFLRRMKAKALLAAVSKFPDFAIVLETYRECLQDVFDLPALAEVLRGVHAGEVDLVEVETRDASPFARSLVYTFVATYLYELDQPLAERRSHALTLDRALLRELCGEAELRELLDPEAIEAVERGLQRLDPERHARDADEVHDLLRELGPLSVDAIAARADTATEDALAKLAKERRATPITVGGDERWIAAQDAGLARDGLGAEIATDAVSEGDLVGAEDALERLLARYARTHGPFATARAVAEFGLPTAAVAAALESLARQGRVVHGAMLPAGTEPEWCDPDVLRRIKRRTLERLRGEIAPVEAAALGRFLPAWQRIGDEVQRTPERALEVALARLEGLALPWSDLVGAVLPARVPGFHVTMLDELCARGELVWIGRGSLGARDGRVALLRRERAALLLPDDVLDPEDLDAGAPVRVAILNELAKRGASFTTGLETAARAVEPGLSTEDFEDALWELVWQGRITNDTTVPLATRAGGTRRAGSLRAGRNRAARGATLAGGRWSLVAELGAGLGAGPDDGGGPVGTAGAEVTHRAHAWADVLLERYGVVSRGVAQAEEIPGGFSRLYPVLRTMEEAGRIRRGDFVAGLGGAQFAHAAAVERLRAARPDASAEPDVLALPATDPANPWGALLTWPPAARDGAPRPRRVAGAWVCLVDGLPVLWVAPNRRGAITFDHPRGEEALVAALGALRALARGRPLVLERLDGAAPDDERVGILERAGLVRDYRGWLFP